MWARCSLLSAPRHAAHDVALRYRYQDGEGELGVIASVSRPFCGDCSRARLTADGQLFACLFAAVGLDLKTPLRAGEDDEQLGERIAAFWGARRDRYSEERAERLAAGIGEPASRVEMYRIGG